jgi:hypothetical protein
VVNKPTSYIAFDHFPFRPSFLRLWTNNKLQNEHLTLDSLSIVAQQYAYSLNSEIKMNKNPMDLSMTLSSCLLGVVYTFFLFNLISLSDYSLSPTSVFINRMSLLQYVPAVEFGLN